MLDLDIKQLIFGVDKIENLSDEVIEKHNYLQYIYVYEEFCGIPQMIINNGLILFIIFIIALKIFNTKTSGFLLITIVTLTVDYLTATSFVVLGYYLCFYINKNMLTLRYEEQNERKLME